jgi:hypothetical protein
MTYAQAKARGDKRGMHEAYVRQRAAFHLRLAGEIYGRRRLKKFKQKTASFLWVDKSR